MTRRQIITAGAASILLAACAPAALLAQSVSPSTAPPAASPVPMPDVAVTAAENRQTANDLAQKLQDIYVFPDVATRYAAMLRAKVTSGAYDSISSGRALAKKLTEDLQAVSPDEHLRVTLRKPRPPETKNAASTSPAQQFPWPAIEEQRWLAPGIAYIRFNVFPGDEETVSAVRKFMEDHASAKTIIFDNRTHHGGGLDEMNAMFPFLFAKPTTLVVMDTRASVDDGKTEPGLREIPGPAGVVRREHFVVPSTTEKRLFGAKVFVLTSGATGSAAEHMTLSLKRTGRATIIGETTAGAGHYGGNEAIGDHFSAFIPVGRKVDPDNGKDWESVGVAPDVAVPAEQALTEALVRSGLSRAEAERINATVHPKEPMQRSAPRGRAAS